MCSRSCFVKKKGFLPECNRSRYINRQMMCWKTTQGRPVLVVLKEGGGGLCIQSAGDLWDDFYKMLHFNRINVFHGQ